MTFELILALLGTSSLGGIISWFLNRRAFDAKIALMRGENKKQNAEAGKLVTEAAHEILGDYREALEACRDNEAELKREIVKLRMDHDKLRYAFKITVSDLKKRGLRPVVDLEQLETMSLKELKDSYRNISNT